MGLNNNELLEIITECIDDDIWEYEKLETINKDYLRGKIDGIIYTLDMCNLTIIADKIEKWVNNRNVFKESD